MKARILWVEGKRAESPSFVPGLRKKGYVIETAPTGEEALRLIPTFRPDLVVIHAASMRTSGKRIAKLVRAKTYGTPIVLITSKEQATANDIPVDVMLALPFTTRKLLNRIRPLLPGEQDHLLQVGQLRLDTKLRRVSCEGREATLTPRLAQMLSVFLHHPGEALERKRLFREVWNTEYTGDTRTLDVHVSWLRRAIEEDPRKPVYLKTIRGMGYRLDVDNEIRSGPISE